MDPAESVYYRHSARVPAASRLSLRARSAIYQRFLSAMAPAAGDRVLDIGVTSDTRHPESNFLERAYPWKQQITCVGTEDGSHLEREYPGVRFIRVAAGERLPFDDDAFDIVFSNAVIEHVGGSARQSAFIAEALRVARRVFLVTPNRWFPVETHTGLPLVHYLPTRVFRGVIRRTRYAIWASEDQLNLLTASSLARLFPPDISVAVEYGGVGPGPLRSNLIAYGRRIDASARDQSMRR